MKYITHAVLAAAATLVLAGPAAAGEIQCKGKEEMLKRYLGLFDNVFNGRKLEMVDEYIAADFLGHDTPPGTPRGPEAIRSFVANTAKSFPTRKLTNDLIICSDDLVVAYQTVEGINDGPMYGKPATNKPFNIKWVDIYRFKDGKVVERWGAGDSLTMMTQLGYQLTPPAAK